MKWALLVRRREPVLLLLIAALVLTVSLRSPGFVASSNVDNIFMDFSILVMMCVAQLFVILSRGIDLSAAAILAFAGMCAALLSHRYPDLSVVVYLLTAVVIGMALGAVNGVLVAFARIPPIVATIGTLAVFRGMTYLVSGGVWVSAHEMPAAFRSFPLEKVLGVQNLIWVAVGVAVVAWVYLNHLRGGREIYAIGVNPAAARYAGLPVRWTEFKVYVISGMVSGLAGYLWTARFAIAFTDAARGMEFTIVAACMIGGISIGGGVGSVGGAVLGAVFIGLIGSALTFLQISPFFETVVSGVVILLAVVVNSRERQTLKVTRLADQSGPVAVGTSNK